MDNQRRISRRALALLLTPLFACIVLVGVLAPMRPRGFTSFEEAILVTLKKRGVPAESVEIAHGWPDTVNYPPYRANVFVKLPRNGELVGRLGCRREKSDCFFNISRLGIDREPLPDLLPRFQWPWLNWLVRTQAELFR